jgi:hypothetical protein
VPVLVGNHDMVDSDGHDRSRDVGAIDDLDIEAFGPVLRHQETVPDSGPALGRYPRCVLFGPQRLVHFEPEPPAQGPQIRMGSERVFGVIAGVAACGILSSISEWPLA